MNLIHSDEELSAEGAYALAIEACAGRLQQAASDGTLSSNNTGYESETEDASSFEEEEEISIAETSVDSLSDDSNTSQIDFSNESSDSSITSSEDIDAEIAFLKLKQKILEKASAKLRQEKAFIACNAHGILRGDFSRESKLWGEAKCVLEVLKKDSKSMDCKETSPTKRKASVELQAADVTFPAVKRRKIDISNVKQISAGSLRGNLTTTLCIISDISSIGSISLSLTDALPQLNTIAVPSSTSHWMPQALVHQISALAGHNAAASLDVMMVPNIGPMVVSPLQRPFRNGIKLTKALEFTNSAQIIAMATPPFSIVHVNKAFCKVSGLAHANVIGKPIEEVLQVEQASIPTDSGVESPEPLQSRFLVSDGKACQIQVTPITDHSQNTCGMTHVLVKIEDRVNSHFAARDVSLTSVIVSGAGSHGEKKMASSDASYAPSSSMGSHTVTIG